MRIVLASASRIRGELLSAAGIVFEAKPAPIDERAVEAPLIAAGKPPKELALVLAEAKALAVNASDSAALVIGADQVLEFGGRRWTKPATFRDARAQLLALSGAIHHLHAGLAVVRGSTVRWRTIATSQLTMRKLSPAFLDDYLTKVGDAALESVGAYQLEGLGIQLFEEIEGDYFAILGLPLLPLLRHLRAEGAIPS